jgi:hypothetical protein
MRALLAIAAAALLAACANDSLPPTPVASRNVISAGVGVASIMTDCVDGKQRDTAGVGAGFMLTTCLRPAGSRVPDVAKPTAAPAPLPADEDPAKGWGIISVGLGAALTFSNCGGWALTGVGLGMGAVVAPCPSPRVAVLPTK